MSEDDIQALEAAGLLEAGTHAADEGPAGSGASAIGPASTVAARIRRAMDELSPGERRVARALLAHYPAAGLETTAALAERAKVSGPTVVRFVSALGYAGYREFQGELREEIQARGASPLTLPGRMGAGTGPVQLRATAADVFHADIEATFQGLPETELKKAVDLLSDRRLTVHALGGRFSRVLADYLQLHLRQMRGRSRLLQVAEDAPSALVEMDRDHVLVVFDFRRYQGDVVAFARAAAERGARVILVTDPWLSPISEVATVVLPVQVDGPSPFDSYAAAIAIVETLVAGMHQKLGETATRRMMDYENAVGRLTPPSVL